MPKAVFTGQEGVSQLARHALEKVTFLQTGGSAHTTAIKSSLGRHLLSQHPLNPFDVSIMTKKFISRVLFFIRETRGRGYTVEGATAFVLDRSHKIALSLFKVNSPKHGIGQIPQLLLYCEIKINSNFCKH